ncbi:hypothetical protein C0J52_02806 [Blattella germanica]|nr:hypothetical protein C0J52_02806 [Blattella germanica]
MTVYIVYIQFLCFRVPALAQSMNYSISYHDTNFSSNLVEGDEIIFEDANFFLGYSNDPWGTSAKLLEEQTKMMELSAEEAEGGQSAKRSKRGVLHLYNMVLCATGCDPLAFKGYGCYCGFLGSGYTVDGIDSTHQRRLEAVVECSNPAINWWAGTNSATIYNDAQFMIDALTVNWILLTIRQWCCKMHDWCYNTAHCPMYLEYFVPYLWKCYRRRPLCALEQDRWSEWGICAQRLCECDRQLAECLRRYPCPRTKAVCTSSPWRLLQNVFML